MTVLVAYDGKEHTKKAVDYAVKYAKAFSERLYVMSVIPSKKHMDEIDDIKEKLESIKLSSNLKVLGTAAFSCCPALKSIEIPASLEEIAYNYNYSP